MAEKSLNNRLRRTIRFPLGIRVTETGSFQGTFMDLASDDLILGETIEQVIEGAEFTLALRYHESNGNLPAPSSLSSIDASKWNQVHLISVDPVGVIKESVKAVKKTLTIPKIIDTIGQREKVNFSQFLSDSLKKHFLEHKEDLTPDEVSLLSRL